MPYRGPRYQPNPRVVAAMATTGPEDARTELLAELLRHRRLMATFLAATGLDNLVAAEHWEISTRKGNEFAAGIPDLVADSQGCKLIVENKLGADFTANQPNAYLRELTRWRANSDGLEGALVIQCPRTRLAYIASKAWRKLGAAAPDDNRGRVDGIPVRVISWQDTWSAFDGIELTGEPEIEFLRHAFLELVPPPPIVVGPLRTEHVTMLLDPTVLEAEVLVEDLLAALPDALTQGDVQAGDVASSKSCVYRGFNVRVDGAYELWVGQSARATLKFRESPLWCQVVKAALSDGAKQRLADAGYYVCDPNKLENWGQGLLVSLKLEPGLEHAALVDSVVRQINEIRELACRSSGAGLDS